MVQVDVAQHLRVLMFSGPSKGIPVIHNMITMYSPCQISFIALCDSVAKHTVVWKTDIVYVRPGLGYALNFKVEAFLYDCLLTYISQWAVK